MEKQVTKMMAFECEYGQAHVSRTNELIREGWQPGPMSCYEKDMGNKLFRGYVYQVMYKSD